MLDLLDAVGSRPALFLDYDGTLTPIVQHPADAVLSDQMRARLRRIAALCPVAIVSGRDRDDVSHRVGLPELAYAGSHGYDIIGPDGRFAHRVGEDQRGVLEEIASDLKQRVAPFPGVSVEEKRFSLAVHFRQAADADAAEVKKIVERAMSLRPSLAMVEGKKVFDIRPSSEWHKGKAVRWLLDALGAADRQPVYLGDDATDELAFGELSEAVTVKVGPGPTSARFRLPDVAAVGRFLDAVSDQVVTN